MTWGWMLSHLRDLILHADQSFEEREMRYGFASLGKALRLIEDMRWADTVANIRRTPLNSREIYPYPEG